MPKTRVPPNRALKKPSAGCLVTPVTLVKGPGAPRVECSQRQELSRLNPAAGTRGSSGWSVANAGNLAGGSARRRPAADGVRYQSAVCLSPLTLPPVPTLQIETFENNTTAAEHQARCRGQFVPKFPFPTPPEKYYPLEQQSEGRLAVVGWWGILKHVNCACTVR